MEAMMGAEGSISVQVFQRLSKGKLFGEVETSFDDLALAMGAATGNASAAAFVPFTHERSAEGKMLESTTATERDLLLMEHLPTVRYLARRIHERLPQHVELDDLVSAGVVGLIDAFSKFDHNKKVQFKSYAQFRIRGAILDSLRTLDWSPRELRRKGRAVEEAIRSVTQRVGRAPLEQEIATEMELSLTDYQGLLGDLKGLEIGSLHTERSEDSGDEELAYIPGSPEDDPLFRCLKGEMKQRLADAIDELPEKERMVLTLYYYEELTMREIGLTLSVVESRVSQIHSSAVLRLRTALAGLRSHGSSGKAKVAVLKTNVSAG
jgi:RNA polymerase sigma factor for flagellar operon FliA